jgi:hypothetical protein
MHEFSRIVDIAIRVFVVNYLRQVFLGHEFSRIVISSRFASMV